MAWCLIPEYADKLKEDIIKGRITPDKLVEMGSDGRRKFFEERFGLENAKEMNASLEAKLLHKNIIKGVEDWAKNLMGLSESHRKDIFRTIEKNRDLLTQDYDAFKRDLVSKRLGRDISHEEAQKIVEFSDRLKELESKIPESSPIRSKERMEYGMHKAIYESYLSELKYPKFKMKNLLKPEFYYDKAMEYISHPMRLVSDLTGISKSILSSWDNSFFGRQGRITLSRAPDIWVKNFLKSWGDIGRTLFHIGKSSNFDPMLAIKADIYSRPNALNGRYKKAKLDIGISGEEAFPTQTQDAIPVLGRLFKASEVAFNGAALRIRADLADRIFKNAEKNGVDLNNRHELESIGELVNSMTGRGDIGGLAQYGNTINATLFSIRYLKSLIDVINPYKYLSSRYSKQARIERAKNLIGLVGSMGGIMVMSELLNPGSVQLDPRDKYRFGKIKIGKGYHDISGGIAPIVSILTQIIPTKHNGKWGLWKVNQKGHYINMWDNKYGQQTALDVVEAFMENKAAPVAAAIRDYLRGKMMTGEKVTAKGMLKQGLTPIPVQNIKQITDLNESDFEKILSIALEELGMGVTTPYKKRR